MSKIDFICFSNTLVSNNFVKVEEEEEEDNED